MPGQVGLSGRMGATLNQLAKRPEVEKVLGIGTSNGKGLTCCLADGLSHTTGRLQSVEADRALHEHARAYFAGTGLPVDLHQGLTIKPDEYEPFEYYLPRIEQTVYEEEAPGAHREWYDRELELARSQERTDLVRSLIAQERWFDLAFLDGGEYASEAEFHALEPHVRGFFVLDDTNPRRSIKNAAAREWLHWSPDWEVVADELNDRSGWCVAKRR